MNVPAGPALSRPGLRWTDVAILTLGMGASVAVSWFIFFRQLDSYSLDLPAMVRPARLMVYATQFLLVGVLAFGLARWRMRDVSSGRLVITALAAWIGEGILLTVFGGSLVANELDPEVAWYYWLVATAGPLQPAVAFLAGWLGLKTASAAS